MRSRLAWNSACSAASSCAVPRLVALRRCSRSARQLRSSRFSRSHALAAVTAAYSPRGQSFEGKNQFSNAGCWARRTVRHAWNDERVLRRALAMLDRIGDRAGAVKLYEEFAARLRTDLDVEPSPETSALVKAI